LGFLRSKFGIHGVRINRSRKCILESIHLRQFMFPIISNRRDRFVMSPYPRRVVSPSMILSFLLCEGLFVVFGFLSVTVMVYTRDILLSIKLWFTTTVNFEFLYKM